MQKLQKMQQDYEKYFINSYKRFDIVLTNGKGSKLYDVNGCEYIDFTSGIGVNVLGHENKNIIEAIESQSKKAFHFSNLFFSEVPLQLAQKLYKLSGLKSFFCNSGLEANECAFKLARFYGSKTNRYKIITISNCFHGRSIASISSSDQVKLHNGFYPLLEGFVHASNIKDIYSKIDNQTVAVMLELIQGEGGLDVMDKSEIKNLQTTLKQKNILLIIDEIQTGIFRTGKFLASEFYDLKPDIITISKGIAGGIPLGVCLSNLNFEIGGHGSTFGGNLIACASSLVVLNTLESEYKNKKLESRIDFFNKCLSELSKILESQGIANFVTGIGLMKGIRLLQKSDSKDYIDNIDIKDNNLNNLLENLIKSSIESGVLILRSGGGSTSTLRFLPPLNISHEDIKEGFKRLQIAFTKK